jgi:hypothetical protein
MTKYYRTPQAADYIGMSTAWMEKERVKGGGPRYAKAGRIVLYAVDELDRWLADRTRNSTSEAAHVS